MYPYNPFMPVIQGGNTNFQYVNDRASAEVFQTNPNQQVLLMDKNEDKFYIVSADASNSRTIEEFTFQKVKEKKSTFVTHEEFSELKDLIESYKPLLESLKE